METSVFDRTHATLVWLVLVGSVVELSGCVGSEANEPAAVGDGDVAAAVRELAASGRGIGDGPARLIAPLSGSLTGSRRPVLRWSGPSAAIVEICADHGCRRPLSLFVGFDHDARPSRALPTGSLFWRLITLGPKHAVEFTPTWELFVPADGRNEVTTRGLRYDANADRFADAAVRAQNGNAATDVLHVFTGGPRGIDAGRDSTRTLDTTVFGVGFSAAGDTNGDGFGDFVLADGRGVVVYAGSATGPGAEPLVVIPVPAGVQSFFFGFEVSGLGDVDGDGYGDILVTDGDGTAWVYLGGPSGPSTAPAWIADSSTSGRILVFMVPGDFNGDGFADVVFTDRGTDGTTEGFRFFRGSAGGLEPASAGAFVSRSTLTFGTAGDVDGDGTIDLVTSEETTLNVFPGGAAFPPSAPTSVVTVSQRPGPLQMGDFNGDGAFDLVATTSTPTSSIFFTDDRVDIYLGSSTGLASTPSQTLEETRFLPDNQLNFGLRLGNGDFDRDGREDLLVGSPPPFPTPFFDTSASVVFAFPGAHHGVRPRPTRLDGTPGFGNAVSAGVPQSAP